MTSRYIEVYGKLDADMVGRLMDAILSDGWNFVDGPSQSNENWESEFIEYVASQDGERLMLHNWDSGDSQPHTLHNFLSSNQIPYTNQVECDHDGPEIIETFYPDEDRAYSLSACDGEVMVRYSDVFDSDGNLRDKHELANIVHRAQKVMAKGLTFELTCTEDELTAMLVRRKMEKAS